MDGLIGWFLVLYKVNISDTLLLKMTYLILELLILMLYNYNNGKQIKVRYRIFFLVFLT